MRKALGKGIRAIIPEETQAAMAAEARINRDYERAWLPETLQPGAVATIPMTITAPGRPGRYALKFDLVKEDFSTTNDMLTPSLKLKRRNCPRIQTMNAPRGHRSNRLERTGHASENIASRLPPLRRRFHRRHDHRRNGAGRRPAPPLWRLRRFSGRWWCTLP